MSRKKRRNKSHEEAPQSISARTAWRWKRQAQARDRELVASGNLPPESVFLIPPEIARRAKVRAWPDLSLVSDSPNIDDLPESKRRRAKKPKFAKKLGASRRNAKGENRS